MEELFQKNIAYLGLNLDLTKGADGKFQNPETQKHWNAFKAVYAYGRKSAFEEVGVFALQKFNEKGGV